jgi:hypothetical protein
MHRPVTASAGLRNGNATADLMHSVNVAFRKGFGPAKRRKTIRDRFLKMGHH